MDDQTKTNLELQEEQNAENEAMSEMKDNELKDQLAEKLGLDPDLESDLLDKIVEREKDHHEKLTKTIKQKRSWRERAESKFNDEKPEDGKEDPETGGVTKKGPIDFDAEFNARMEERDLKDLNLPDDVETKVRKIATLENISIREAVKDPYIVAVMEQHAREERIKSSSPSRGNKGSYVSSVDVSKSLNPEDFDFNSQEGVKAWHEAKLARSEYEKTNR